jgi:hypothetical protein
MVAVQRLRAPESALLQVAGAFQALTLASVAFSSISMIAVMIPLVASRPP